MSFRVKAILVLPGFLSYCFVKKTRFSGDNVTMHIEPENGGRRTVKSCGQSAPADSGPTLQLRAGATSHAIRLPIELSNILLLTFSPLPDKETVVTEWFGMLSGLC